MELNDKLRIYYLTAILGVVFAVIGFSYNAWRLEVTEDNSNIRTASFEVLLVLAELEQVVYAAHYDKDIEEGNPRKGWIKIGLITDLSGLISRRVEERAQKLKVVWGKSWKLIDHDKAATEVLVKEIESVRSEIKTTLKGLE